MARTLLAIVGVVAFLSGAHVASAFTTHPVDPVITFDRPADPDQLSDKVSNGQLGGTTFGLPGGLPGGFKLQFSRPSSSNTRNSPFCRVPKYGIRAERTSLVRLGPLEPGHRRKPREGGPPAANRPPAAAKTAREP